MVAHILGRPVLLLNAGTVPPHVGMHLHLPPTEVEPLGRRLRVHRQDRAFEYFPIRKGRPQWLPSTTIVLVRQAWHYTAAITTAQATWRHARSGQAGNLPLVQRPPPDGPAGPTAPGVEAPAVVAAQGAVSGLARNQGQRDDVRGLPNMGNTCAVNAATQAVLLPIVEAHGLGEEAWDPQDTTLLSALTGALTSVGEDSRLRVSAALCKAVADGCPGTRYLDRVGHRDGEVGQHLDLEEVLLRCLAVLKSQSPQVLACTEWQVWQRHRCDAMECNLQGIEISTAAYFNPVMLTPQPGELADALRDTLRRQYAAPHPCLSCGQDAEVASLGEEGPPPKVIVCHVRRGQGPVGGQWDRTRVNFTERVEVRAEQYRLRSIAQYAGPGDRPSPSTGGHYTA